MRFVTYSLLSTLATVTTVVYAFATRVQFYPSVIYLVTSKSCILVLGNMALVLTLLFGRICKGIFLGTLREQELDRLYDNSRYAVTETCLALTIFREELSVRLATLFTALLFLKSFHWLCEARLEFLEMQDAVDSSISRLAYTRIFLLMASLAAVDTAFVFASVFVSFDGSGIFKPSAWLLFGFEFLVLCISATATFLRFMLHLLERRARGTMPSKAALVMILDFMTDGAKLGAYLAFFVTLFIYYGLPLHIARDLYLSIRGLTSKIDKFRKYRTIMRHLDTSFPDATPEEVAALPDQICIIYHRSESP